MYPFTRDGLLLAVQAQLVAVSKRGCGAVLKMFPWKLGLHFRVGPLGGACCLGGPNTYEVTVAGSELDVKGGAEAAAFASGEISLRERCIVIQMRYYPSWRQNFYATLHCAVSTLRYIYQHHSKHKNIIV
eukprot:scaffold62815_cov31-Prasinocladus_malaysianus.AAC.3